MNVGDYVRTDIGEIRKVVRVTDDLYILDKDVVFAHKDKIKKSSPNIIELFEEHDLVVIEYYSLRYNERVTRLFEVTFKDGEYINLSNAKCEFMLVNGEFNKGDKELKPIIKSIVTKEQFSSMEYKI